MSDRDAVHVRRFTPDEWRLFRDLRLRALEDAPSAFGSSHAREAGFGEDVWRERTTRMACAEIGTTPAGIVGAGLPDAQGVEVVSMWVAPEFRRRGVGAALLAWVLDVARADGRRWVGLYYADGNDDARRLYEHHGFVVTGERKPLPSRPGAEQHRMRLDLGDHGRADVREEVIPVLRVADAARAVAWYQRLGFRKEWEHQFEAGFPWFVSIARGTVRMYLSEHEGDARPNTLVHLNVRDVDAVAAEFGEVVDEHGLAGREVDLVDPDGNRLRIATPRR
jgi:ribosomal protein S18 acetylase RimI-like enzyme